MRMFTSLLFAALVFASASTAVTAAPKQVSVTPNPYPYDGYWSVVIQTLKGVCDRAYRFGVEINGGNVSLAGTPSGGVRGRSVRMSVSDGTSSAKGSGTMTTAFTARGSWHGKKNKEPCSGVWEASRKN